MKTKNINIYKIVANTDSWIAQRDIKFKGKTHIIVSSKLTLKEAQKELLNMYNKLYDTNFSNWGLVIIHSTLAWSHPDGTRGFEFDSRYYNIIEESELI